MKKLMCAIIALIMIIAMLPANVFASDTFIFVSYGNGIILDVESDIQYEKDTKVNKLYVYQECMTNFKVKSSDENSRLLSVTVTSGIYNNSLNDTNCNTKEGKFKADSSGTVTFSLDLKKDRAYAIYADFENNETIISYSGDVIVDNISGIAYENSLKRGILTAKEEGKISFDVKLKSSDYNLESVQIYSKQLPCEYGDPFNIAEGEFKADSSGKATVTLDVKKDKRYTIKLKTDAYGIYISYSGDVELDNIKGLTYKNDTKGCILITKEEGKISFDVKLKSSNDKLESVQIYSKQLPCEYNDPFNIAEGEFKADSSGKATVTLDVKKDKWYIIKFKTDAYGIYIAYSGAVKLDNITGLPYKIDTKRCILIVKEEGEISFNVKSNSKSFGIKRVTIMSADEDEATSIGKYNTKEGVYEADSAGVVKIKMDVNIQKSYVLNIYAVRYEEEDDSVVRIKPVANISKVSKGIKLSLKTKGVTVKKLKDDGYSVEYKIYRATKKNGKYILKKTTLAKTYTDKNVKKGKRYFYKVKALIKDESGKVVESTSFVKVMAQR